MQLGGRLLGVMLKKEISKLLEQQRREYQRYLDVVTEAIEGQIKSVEKIAHHAK